MKIKLLPDPPTEHRCDACQRMFTAGTLVDDRGRFVCQKCYDTMNPPVVIIEDAPVMNRLNEAYQAFFKTELGRAINYVGYILLVVMWLLLIYLEATDTQELERPIYVVQLVTHVLLLPLFLISEYVSRRKARNQPPPPGTPSYTIASLVIGVLFFLAVILLCWLDTRTGMVK